MCYTIKKIILFVAILFSFAINAQTGIGIIGDDNWLEYWTHFRPKQANYKDAKIMLSGQIKKNTTLTKNNTYLLVGDVFVTDRATLTIEAGTVIRGDFETNGTLIITEHAKIIANGTAVDPIIFTSNINGDRKAGDWGGLIILGDAPINKSEGVACINIANKNNLTRYGGTNEKSNSGLLNFVRIEFTGKKINKEKGLNALTLAGVGAETKISNIQISYAGDDAVEIKGGYIDLSKMVIFKTIDDDFDLSMGTQFSISNSLIIRDPFLSENSGARVFEVESADKLDNTAMLSNMTAVKATNICALNTEKEGYVANDNAIYIADESKFEISNSVISGFGTTFLLANKAATSPSVVTNIIANNIFCNSCDTMLKAEITFNENMEFSTEIEKTIFTKNNHINKLKVPSSSLFKNVDPRTPDYRMIINQNFAWH